AGCALALLALLGLLGLLILRLGLLPRLIGLLVGLLLVGLLRTPTLGFAVRLGVGAGGLRLGLPVSGRRIGRTGPGRRRGRRRDLGFGLLPAVLNGLVRLNGQLLLGRRIGHSGGPARGASAAAGATTLTPRPALRLAAGRIVGGVVVGRTRRLFALMLLDGGDQLALTHAGGALDADLAGQRPKLRQQHRGQRRGLVGDGRRVGGRGRAGPGTGPRLG